LGRKGYVAKIVQTPNEYIVFANEPMKSAASNGNACNIVSTQGQICTFDNDDNLYIILNSRKMRDQINQLELMLDPIKAMEIAREYETTSQRLEMREKSRWILERFAGLVSQIGYGSTGD
jgi:hypothetical protein